MRTLSKTTGALAAAAACSLLLAPAAHATETPDTYTIPLHQAKDLPLTATSWTGDKEQTCADIPADQDGWHFVLKGRSYEFVELTVVFEKDGEKVITSFGPPDAKHAFAASTAGDTLVSAEAVVKGLNKKGKKTDWFNLSHTCPASDVPDDEESPSTEPSPSSSEPTSTETPSTEPTPSASEPTSSETPSTEPSSSPSETMPGGTTPSAAPSASESEGASTGDLAETGSSTPVGALAGVAAALVAGGAFLVLRRRKSAQQH
ncbi:LPXTG cell wall anchor domain-containing protein [Streptomyces sp. MUM 203J]|uniref:LPXTG cell wall anchor domain-containing protein n=1 Tax=Streptomyces sp. MUM 203J TaxID=2791990 RepID=UPI001F03CE43|nr:LPXTG cell wall anchor domain-containing protein [Streptomyces sp. MUM 203J]MCH0538310.1 LPXTG cell wall anchor domain-containing protein [Streptomyces sp. MUM 203J]